MKTAYRMLACAMGAAALAMSPVGVASEAQAQEATAADTPTAIDTLTVADIAGTWVEPVTEAEQGGLRVYGSENVVKISPDGTFTDGVEISITIAEEPLVSGTYQFFSKGVVSLADGQITWTVNDAKSVPVYPDNVSAEKRAAMQAMAKHMAAGMIETETFPIVAYDGVEMTMDAGSGSVFEEYSMTRRSAD